MFPNDWSWVNEDAKTSEEKKPEIPFWDDPEQVAKTVYEFWINSMQADRIDSMVMPHYLSELPADVRQNLIESFNVNIVQPIQKMREETAAILESRPKEDEDSYQRRCYTCDTGVTFHRGGICVDCQRRFR